MTSSKVNAFGITFDSNRVFGLDILRAVAILCVIFGHGNLLLPAKFHIVEYDGVSLFFVLSGFLIGGILIKELEKGISRNSLMEFWKRRWFRTLPNYFLILTILALPRLFLRKDLALIDIAKYYIFSQNLFTPHPEHFFPEAWSLSVEEWFYLVVPVVTFALIKICRLQPKTSILTMILALTLSITLVRFITYINLTNVEMSDMRIWDLVFRKRVITRLDSLMFGVLGAYCKFYYSDFWRKFRNKIVFVTGLLLVIMGPAWHLLLPKAVYPIFLYVFSFTVTSIGTLMLLPFLSNVKKGSGAVYKIITTISLISYSAYLLNLTVVQGSILPRIKWLYLSDGNGLIALRYVCYWLITLGFSLILFKYFEQPMMKLRDKKQPPEEIKQKSTIPVDLK